MKKILFLLLCSITSAYIGPVTSFNTGQVSPLLEARADFEKYGSSCRLLENMFVTVQGPAIKRPGTEYIATAKAGKIRLIPFEFSTDDAYILEFGDNYIRFYLDGAQILTEVGGPPVEIATQHETGDLFNIQFVQTDNDMYIVDNENPPQILTRTSHTDWSIRNVPFTRGPFLPENDLDISITPSGTAGNITLTCSAEIFKSGHKGSLWAIEQVRGSSIVSGTFTSNSGTSEDSPFFMGLYSFTTSGSGTGTVTLQRSTNGGISYRNALAPLTDQLFDNPAEFEEDGAQYRVVRSGSGNGEDIVYTFTIADNFNKGVVEITKVVSSTVARASVITELADTSATTTWREGYWSDYRGWPGTLTFHQQRLVYGGSDSFPQELWFGEQNPDDYANFLEGTLDTAAFTFALEGQNPIRWMLSQDYLLIGTSGSCGKWGEQGKSATPTSPSFQKQTRNGAAAIMALFAGDDIIYVERGGRKVRRFGFDLQSDKYLSPELTVLSPEITDSGIINADSQLRPNPILWCALNNGEIATLTHQLEQSVIAWTKQVTDGDFESVAVISSGEEEDEVWVSVKRVINGNTNRYIEQFQPNDWGSDDDDLYFVDSGLTYDEGAAITVTGATQADPGVITAGTHGFSDGDQVLFSDVGGMIELNGNVYTVASSDADTFELKDATDTWDYDTSGFTAYTSGGSVQQVEDTFAGLDHLEGETVKVWADGIVLSDEVVVNGVVTIDVASSIVAIGLPYTAKIETLPIRIDPQDIALNKKIQRLWVDLYKSGAFSFGPGSTADLTTVNMWQESTLTAKQPLYTSTRKMKQFAFTYAGYVKQTVFLQSDQPVPLTIRAIVAEIEGRR